MSLWLDNSLFPNQRQVCACAEHTPLDVPQSICSRDNFTDSSVFAISKQKYPLYVK